MGKIKRKMFLNSTVYKENKKISSKLRVHRVHIFAHRREHFFHSLAHLVQLEYAPHDLSSSKIKISLCL